MTAVIDIALIGAGRWGTNLLRVLSSMRNVRLHAVCDLSISQLGRAREIVGKSEINYTTCIREALAAEALDAAVIATPAELHLDHGRAALARGLDVLVEKPLATSLHHGRLLVQEADVLGSTLMVGHILEYHPILHAIESITTDSALGKVREIHSERHGCRCGDAWWSLAPHDIGIARRLLGPAERIRATRTSGDGLRVEIELERGTSTIHVSRTSRTKTRRLTIITDLAQIVFDDLADVPLRINVRPGQNLVAIQRQAIQSALNRATRQGTEPLRCELEAFVAAVVSRRPPLTDGDYGVHVLEVLEAGERSLNQGGVVIRFGDTFSSDHLPPASKWPLMNHAGNPTSR